MQRTIKICIRKPVFLIILNSFMPVCGLEDIDILLTNKELDPKIAEDFIKAGVDLRLV